VSMSGELSIQEIIDRLLDKSPIDRFVECCVPHSANDEGVYPKTSLLYVRFSEDRPLITELAKFLWAQAVNYALPRRRRLAFQEALAAGEADLSAAAELISVVKNSFIEFKQKNPSRASEVGEILAYCIAVHHLKAAQVAAKMSLKTSSNMPVHGLDGIHAVFENEALTIYFLESKLARSANDGVSDFAESAAGFMKNEKQYFREYELVGDLGNLDVLVGEERELALQYFDVVNNPQAHKRERWVGVICYSEKKHFSNKLSVTDGPVTAHEKHFVANYASEFAHHQSSALTHILKHGADARKSLVFFVAVPDVDELREKFYKEMGLPDAGSV